MAISIHVPSWGTTGAEARSDGFLSISIHVPSWGTTITILSFLLRTSISIHVPSWGTTRCNSRNLLSDRFQSTFPRGERLRPPAVICHYSKISIHVPSWGTTSTVDVCSYSFKISIHVPSWGTTEKSPVITGLTLFQSTFPRGERRFCPHSLPHSAYFNPRSLVGNDISASSGVITPTYFNPRSLVGNDVGKALLVKALSKFQSTFPRGERRYRALYKR